MSPQRVQKTTYNQISRICKINVHIYLDEYNRICALEEGLIWLIIFEVFGTVGLVFAVNDIVRPGIQRQYVLRNGSTHIPDRTVSWPKRPSPVVSFYLSVEFFLSWYLSYIVTPCSHFSLHGGIREEMFKRWFVVAAGRLPIQTWEYLPEGRTRLQVQEGDKTRQGVVLSASQWTDKQPTGSDCLHSHGSATHLVNNYKSSAPEDGHKVARNMLSNL